MEEPYKKACNRLYDYLKTGIDKSNNYAIPLFAKGEPEDKKNECYYDLACAEGTDLRLPTAAMTPVNSERMKVQAGVFTFFDIRSKPRKENGKLTYRDTDGDFEAIQKEYLELFCDLRKKDGKVPKPFPFLFKIILNHFAHEDFVQYVRAVGVRKYKMYPEIDKLAGDILDQAF